MKLTLYLATLAAIAIVVATAALSGQSRMDKIVGCAAHHPAQLCESYFKAR
jgi:hypothetical protein